MKCPFCSRQDSRVIDSRELPSSVRRRRECTGCGRRYTSYERVEGGSPSVRKKDGRREPFDRQKLLQGIRVACAKRPIAIEAIQRTVDEIEAEMIQPGEAEISSQALGELVMNRLRDLDQIAYIRFASVYRSFADLESLRRAIEALDSDRVETARGGAASGASA